MKKFAIILLTISLSASATNVTRDWDYYGEAGPTFWGDLQKSYEMCSKGYHQSPINLLNPIAANLQTFDTAYATSDVLADDAGYTLRVDLKSSNNQLHLGDETFQLNEFHFHQPAEHTVNGKLYPLELHFVNIHENGGAVALGVFFEEGAENAILKTLLPAFKTSHDASKKIPVQINPNDLQPPKDKFYRYEGSLTTPPCREGIVWLIHQQPMTLSKEQLTAFSEQMEQNARPLQKMHSRMLMQGG